MTLDKLHEIEKNLKINHDFAEILPFLILCQGWREKDPDFILNNLNALGGNRTWEILTDEEKCKMYDYLCEHEIEDDERWEGLKESVLEYKSKRQYMK